MIEGDFATCMSLYHGYELLLRHGLNSLFSFLQGIIGTNGNSNPLLTSNVNNNNNNNNGGFSTSRTRAELMKNPDFSELFQYLESNYKPIKHADPNALTQQSVTQTVPVLRYGHPKMKRLVEIVVDHFDRYERGGY